MNQQSVSIIIPCYNQATYLPQAVDSALAQTYDNVEVIVVNDGSTDGTQGVATGYGEKVKVVSQENMGLSYARNAGINASSADFILPLDADDWIDPNYLSKTTPLMQDRVGIVGTHAACFGIRDYVWNTFAPTLDQIKQDNSIPVCSLIRRDALQEAGWYNPA